MRQKRNPRKNAPAAAHQPEPFPIVGIGASAGGLEAFLQLLKHLPTQTGMGFVLVQHLDPTHDSALPQLLAPATAMPVAEVADGMRVEPDHVYVIPPDKTLTITAGVLRLVPRAAGPAPPHSIDTFLESLAHDRRERAIGVILSGTATDGTVGLEAIKSEGGITFAQDASAKYDSMPLSAVAAGCVDFELSAEAIAQELVRIAAHPSVAGRTAGSAAESGATRGTRSDGQPSADDAGDYKRILLLVRNHSRADFSLYKPATIRRRITRRMVLKRFRTLAAYGNFLRGNPRELAALYSDLLIGVTSFFRNPEAFELLKRKVFIPLLAQPDDTLVRIWVLGCSTGQEAYSIAMAFAEAGGSKPRARKLQIFATDLNEATLDKARAGLYAKNLMQNVSPERLARFFVPEPAGYRVRKELRETVVFARHNVLQDPPFSHVDLITCRNLLIYIETSLQKRIVPMFHYALNPGGALFLGASESVAGFTDLFEPFDKKHKLFARKPGKTGGDQPPAAGTRHPGGEKTRPARLPPTAPAGFPPPGLQAQREADRLTLNQFAPPGVLIGDDLHVLQFRGPIGAYLELPRGKASFDILKMARDGLMLPLRAAINRARREGRTVRKERIIFKHDGDTRLVTVQVSPLHNLKERFFLILFEEKAKNSSANAPGSSPPPSGPPPTARRLHYLENELAKVRDYVQMVREQNEAAYQELQASNEEVTSANEELQSLNEELETSKEELESTNEELITLNEEMIHRNSELNRLNADLRNLHVSINTAIVVFNHDLTVRSFTPLAEKALNFLPADIGRSLGGIRHNLVLAAVADKRPRQQAVADDAPPRRLEDLVQEVVDTAKVRECEARDGAGRWYSLCVRPYVTEDDRIDGAVLVLVDIDRLKHAEHEAQAARDYAEAALRTARDPLLVLHADFRVNTANEAFYRVFKTSLTDTEDHLLWDLGNGQWDHPRLRQGLEEGLPRNDFFDDLEITRDFPGLGRRTMLLHARQFDAVAGTPRMILLGIEDITERREAEAKLQESETRYRTLFNSIDEGFCIIELIHSPDGRTEDYRFLVVNPSFEKQCGLLDAPGRRMRELHPSHEAHWFEIYGNVARTGEPVRFVNEARALGRWFDVYAFQLGGRDSPRVAILFKDITTLHQGALELERARDEAVAASRAKDEFLAALSHELRTPLNPVLILASDNASNGGLPESVRADFDTIRNNIGLQARLIDDLLDMTRISSGKLRLELQACHLHAVLRDAIAIVRSDLDAKHLRLSLDLAAPQAGVRGDPVRLQQVFWNILRNAIHFTPEGGSITVASRATATGDRLVVTITDTGGGIATADLERIFGTFVQGDAAVGADRRSGGLGLGLAISRKMVELHAGSIHATSPGRGHGSTFLIELPLDPRAEQLSPRPAAPAATPSPGPGRSGRLLLVDDHDATLTAMRRVLERQGYQVRTARSVAEAAQVAHDHPLDVLISDIGLPDGDGYSLMSGLRARHPALQGIALSGYGAKADVMKAGEAGFAEHVTKPVEIGALIRALEKVTRGGPPGVTATAPVRSSP